LRISPAGPAGCRPPSHLLLLLVYLT